MANERKIVTEQIFSIFSKWGKDPGLCIEGMHMALISLLKQSLQGSTESLITIYGSLKVET